MRLQPKGDNMNKVKFLLPLAIAVFIFSVSANAGEVTFEDKVQSDGIAPLLNKEKVTYADINEMKNAINDNNSKAVDAYTKSEVDALVDAKLDKASAVWLSHTLDSPGDGDVRHYFPAPAAETIQSVSCYVDPDGSGESAVITLAMCEPDFDPCTDIDSSSITCGNTVTADDGSLSTPAITAGYVMRLTVGTITGTVSALNFTVIVQ